MVFGERRVLPRGAPITGQLATRQARGNEARPLWAVVLPDGD